MQESELNVEPTFISIILIMYRRTKSRKVGVGIIINLWWQNNNTVVVIIHKISIPKEYSRILKDE